MRTNKTLPALDKRYTKEEVLKCIEECEGVRTMICKKLDCSQRQLETYIAKVPETQVALIAARNKLLDIAESVILNNLLTGTPELRQKAAEFTLKTIGRQRGWGIGDWPAMKITTETQADGKTKVQAIFGIAENDGNTEDQ